MEDPERLPTDEAAERWRQADVERRERVHSILKETGTVGQTVFDRKVLFWLVGIPVLFAVMLVGIYGLTKFVKWAWFN